MTKTLSQRLRIGLLALVAGAALTLGAPHSLLAQDDTTDDQIRELAESVAAATDAHFAWNDAVRLLRHRDKAASFAVDALKGEDVTSIGRIAIGRVLIDVGEYGRATEALLQVAGSQAPVATRVEAIRLLSQGDDDDGTIESIWKLLDESLDPKLRAALAKCIWDLDPDTKAKDKLKELVRSEDFDLQVEGALALAEIRDFSPDVKKVLHQIRDEPTDRGRLASALLSRHEYEMTQVARAAETPSTSAGTTSDAPSLDGAPGQGARLVAEAIARLRQRFVDPAEIDESKLWEGAATGLVNALGDPHTVYQSVDDRAQWTDHLTKEYGGIGAYVGYDDQGFFIVTRPMFQSPAWKAGLKSGDRVLEVDGWPTAGEDLNDIVDRLRGPAGKVVEINVYRKGWEKPRKWQVQRGTIKVPSVYSAMLPGQVGYVLIETFAQHTAQEFVEAMQKIEKDGAKNLVIDLRFNGGGYLTAAAQIAEYLLPRGKLLVETKGRGEGGQPWMSRGMSTEWSRTVPMTVLVNGASASASEIVSGCWQKHGRARVIGLRSFGKGSVQDLFPLYTRPYAEPFVDVNKNGEFDRGESFEDLNGNGQFDAPALKITIARYYIGNTPGKYEFSPSREEMIVKGQRVFLGGVEPDVPVEPEGLTGWRAEEIAKLQEKNVFDAYFDEQFAKPEPHAKLLRLAEQDTREPRDYPGFEEFYKSLETQLSEHDVWRWLHVTLRSRASDELGRLLVGDWAEDAQLQAAIRDLAKRDSAGAEAIRNVPELSFVLEKEFETPATYGEDLKTARPVRR